MMLKRYPLLDREVHAFATAHHIRTMRTIGSRDYFEWLYGPNAMMVNDFDHNSYLRYVTAHGIVPFQDIRDKLEAQQRIEEATRRVH